MTVPMVIWASLFVSIFVYQFQLGGGIPSGEDQGSPPNWAVVYSITLFALSSGLRWLILPKIKKYISALVVLIIGVALAEAIQFGQMFLIGPKFPETQLSLFVLSIVAVGQWLPYYMRKFVIEPVAGGDATRWRS